ncbi:MAG: hypothetical protein K6L76_06890 [Agarilytica sp.]
MKKLIIISICLGLLSGCSIKVAYHFLGVIGKWYVGSYVSLNHSQKRLLDDTLDEFHQWHRGSQLKIYAQYIDSVIPHLESEHITGEWIYQQTDIAQDMLDVSMLRLKPSITMLMATFSDQQIEEIVRELEKDRKKYRKKYIDISPEKQSKKRKAQLLDYIGRFFGRLTSEQNVWLNEWERSLLDYENLTLQQQKILSDKLSATFADRSGKLKLDQLVDDIIFYRSDKWDEALKSVIDQNQVTTYALIAKLINSQTPKQRHKMLRKLRDYRDDCLALAAKN